MINPGKPTIIRLTPAEVDYVAGEAVSRTERRTGSRWTDTLGAAQDTMDYIGCVGEYAAHKWLFRKPLVFQDWSLKTRKSNMIVNGHTIRITTTRRAKRELLWAKENSKGEPRELERAEFMLLCHDQGGGAVEIVGWMPVWVFYKRATMQPVKKYPGRQNYTYPGMDMMQAWSFPLALSDFFTWTDEDEAA